MATALTAREQELVDALELFLEATEDMEPRRRDGLVADLQTAWTIAQAAIAHTQYERHCCNGGCDLDECGPEWRGKDLM